MATADDRDHGHVVVVNDEHQYSVWESERTLPRGWSYAGMRGTRAECLDHIAEIWVDLRPRSVAEAPEGHRRPIAEPADRVTLVDRLCLGDHALELPARPAGTVERLAEEGVI